MGNAGEEEPIRTPEEEGRPVARIESFSDGVFAVAITLLVLNLVLPNIPLRLVDRKLPQELIRMLPRFEAFIISFVIIGMFWIAHHLFFRYVKRYDHGFLWLNLLFLMTIVFLPFTTNLLSIYGESRVAVIFYASSMAGTALVLCLLWFYATRNKRLVGSDLDTETSRHLITVYLNVAFIFLISIGISYINTDAAKYFWLLLIPNSFLLERFRRRRIRASRPQG